MSNFVSNSDAATLFEAVGKKKLTVTDTMPTAAEANVGVSYLYLGADTQDFEEGGVYKCQEVTPATDPKTYEYIHIFTAKVDLSLYKRIFGGTVAAWGLLTDEQKAQYEYTFFDDDADNYLTIVDTVEDGNMHAVTSNAVAEEVDAIDAEISDIVNYLNVKNLLASSSQTKTESGITFTVNSDGSITVNGTATANVEIAVNNINFAMTDALNAVGKKLIISGCPADTTANTYFMYVNFRNRSDDSYYGSIEIEGESIEYINDNIKYISRVYIYVKSGITVSNKTFYPMIRFADIEDNSYVPYAMTNKEITDAINTVKTITPTFTGATFLDGAITQNNKHISMNIRVKLKSDLAANSSVQLATNMPLPKGYVPFFAVVQSATNQNMAFIDTAGNLTFHTYIALSTAPIIALSVGYDIA